MYLFIFIYILGRLLLQYPSIIQLPLAHVCRSSRNQRNSMAMSQSTIEKGSDEVESKQKVTDVCTFCLSRGKQQPATHFCFECGPFGRYICGTCEQNHEMFLVDHLVTCVTVAKGKTRYDNVDAECKNLKKEKEELKVKLKQLQSMVKEKEEFLQKIENVLHKRDEEILALRNQLKIFEEDNIKLMEEKLKLEKRERILNREIDGLKDGFAIEKRKTDDNIQKLIKERDDLRDRFAKVAGPKLSDQNADIAVLSDPNRAMKLSERFGQLYDDEWTNAFEALSDADMKICLQTKEAVALLLKLLKECLDFCQKIKTTQMESLINVFLHPVQNPKIAASGAMPNMQDKSDKYRFGAKEEKTLRELRRHLAVEPFVTEQVKQAFIVTVKSGQKEMAGFDKKHIEACIPYLSKCADLCWLMVLHDPPLFAKFDVKQGEKLDPNIYSMYSTFGNKIDFLVWPPLYNGEGGGLLAKGAAEPL